MSATRLSEEQFVEKLNLVAVADPNYETPECVDAYDACLASHRALASAYAEVEKRLAVAERALLGKGYRKSCDIPACNCGDQWNHGGHANERLREISDAMPYENGKTVLQQVESLTAKLAEAEQERDANFKLYQGYWKRCQEAESRLTALEEALRSIAEHPHCAYNDGANDSYMIGVADGHRCAANVAKQALAPATVQTQQGG